MIPLGAFAKDMAAKDSDSALGGESRCRSCGSQQLVSVLTFGKQPMCNAFPAQGDLALEPSWELRVVLCESCSLLQLSPDSPGVTETAQGAASFIPLAHVAQSVEDLLHCGAIKPLSSFVEFPTPHGVRWGPELLRRGLRPALAGLPADLVVDNHGLAHEVDSGAHIERLATCLKPDGVLVAEFHHLLRILQGGEFDAFRHGHYSYWSLRSFRAAAAVWGLTVTGAQAVPLYGGSLQLRAVLGATHEVDPFVDDIARQEDAEGIADVARLQSFGKQVGESAIALRRWLESARDKGERVVGYGAPSRATPLLCSSQIGPELLPFTADLAEEKHGRRIPGCGIPIVSPEAMLATRPDIVLVLVWDLLDEVTQQLAVIRSWGGRFAVPLPLPHEVS